MFWIIVMLEDKPLFSVLAEARKFLSKILWYAAPSFCPSMRGSLLYPKHNASTTVFDCGDGVLRVILKIYFPSNKVSRVKAKELDVYFI